MPTFTGTAADETLTGTEGADVLIGNGGYDTFVGQGGDDVIDGLGTMAGGEGNDRFVLRLEGLNTRTALVAGGNGVDTIDLSLTPLANSFTGGVVTQIVADGETITGRYTLYPYRSGGVPNTPIVFLQATGIERILSYQIFDPNGYGPGSIDFDFTGRTTPIEIVGGALVERIRGGSGQDILSGGGGDDTLYLGQGDWGDGGTGNDTLVVSSAEFTGVALIDGGAGTDTLSIDLVGAFDGVDLNQASPVIRNIENITLTQAANYAGQSVVMTVFGTAGDNVISFTRATGATALATNITFRAGAGADVVTSSGTNDFLYGDAGNDRLTGNGLLDGGDGNDVLSGQGRLLGGDGDDQITVTQVRAAGTNNYSVGTNEVIGGAGIDTFTLSSSFNQTVSLRSGTATATPTSQGATWQGSITLSGIENVIGGSGADTIEGDDGVNDLRGGRGADIIRGGGGDDVIYGHGIESTIMDTAGDQLFGEAGNDTIYGYTGNDMLDGGVGDDRLYGGGGTDILLGGDGSDQLFGEDGADRQEGGAGMDRLDGGQGDDTLIGGAGNDALNGGGGSDNLDGGDGFDVARFDFSVDLATFSYEGGYIRVTSPGAIDTLINIEVLAFNDAVLTVGADGRVSARPAATNGTQGADRLTGTAGDDVLIGLGGDDVLRGGAGNDMLNGGGGNDVLYGGSGANVLDGGDGTDAAVYGGTLRSYAIVSSGFVGGGVEGGSDYLTSIESLRFLDGRLSFDVNDASTAVYRLYDAAFDRAPDVFGLADFSRAISEGRATLQQILDVFAGSAEFQARYGALNNEQFVREMYRFSLNREGDAAGVASYVAALDGGTATRAQVLGVFSESQEHRNLINAQILANGQFVQDEQTASVARLYDSVFNRLPDLGGLQGYRAALDNGYTLKDVATVLIGSPEFQTRFGQLTNQQFVEQIYRFVLDREGDAAGIQSYVQALNNGFTRTDVVMVLSDSLEHRISYQATYDSQIRRLGVDGYDPSGSGVGRSVAEGVDKHHDAFVLPAEPAFEIGHHDDAVAVLETAANDLVPIDGALTGSWMLVDPMIVPDDLTVGHHRSDWM